MVKFVSPIIMIPIAVSILKPQWTHAHAHAFHIIQAVLVVFLLALGLYYYKQRPHA